VRTRFAATVAATLTGFVLCAWLAYGGTSGSGEVSLTIQPIDCLSVTDGGAIVLTGTAGSNALAGAEDRTAALSYSHNSPTARKIVAEVRPENNPAGHDISLRVSVAGGTGFKTLVLNGMVQGTKEVLSNLPAGAHPQRLVSYQAGCTASGTRIGSDTDFRFTITFTTTD
jgi:hypothetical protein